MYYTLSLLILSLAAALLGAAAEAGHMEEVIVHGSHEKRSLDVMDELTVAPDAAQLLKKAPGASVNQNGPLTGIPQYRGMYGPRLGVQLDGTQLAPAGPNWMDPPLSYAAAAQLQSLQLYRGIAPVSVVQESIGGAINAVSQRGEFSGSTQMELKTHLVASGQSVSEGGLLGITLLAVNQQHRLRLAGMGESGNTADFARGRIEPSEYQRNRYSLGYGFRSGAHTLQLDYSRSETGDAGTPALPMDIRYIDGDLYSLGYNYTSGSWSFDARLFGSQLDHAMTNYHLRNEPGSAGLWRRNTTDSANRGFKALAILRDAAGSWTLGVDGLESTHNSVIDNPRNPVFYLRNFNQAERRIVGLFAERQHNFGKAWSAELGLRYNRVDMDAGEVNGTPAMMMPAAAMLRDNFNAARRRQTDNNVDAVAKAWYRAGEHVSYYAGVAQKSRSPSYQERYLWLPLQATGGLADGMTYTGNIELRPEVSRELELGLDLQYGGLMLSPRLFYRRVQDYIQGVPSTLAPAQLFVAMMNRNNGSNNPSPLQFQNVDAIFSGFDMDWRYQLDAHWALQGLLSFVRGERDHSDDDLYRIAPLNGSVQLAYRAAGWGAALESRVYGRQDNVSADNRELASPAYKLLNVSAYWMVQAQLRVAVGLENALDADYSDHLGGINRVRGNEDIAPGERLPGTGRNLFVRLDYQF